MGSIVELTGKGSVNHVARQAGTTQVRQLSYSGGVYLSTTACNYRSEFRATMKSSSWVAGVNDWTAVGVTTVIDFHDTVVGLVAKDREEEVYKDNLSSCHKNDDPDIVFGGFLENDGVFAQDLAGMTYRQGVRCKYVSAMRRDGKLISQYPSNVNLSTLLIYYEKANISRVAGLSNNRPRYQRGCVESGAGRGRRVLEQMRVHTSPIIEAQDWNIPCENILQAETVGSSRQCTFRVRL